MCSLNDVDIDEKDELMVEKPSPLLLGPGINCRKCSQKTAELVLRLRDVYCRECFLLSTVHKFRAVLGKSRLVKPKERVLIGFSGSQSSVALLNLIHQGLNVPSHKRLMFLPSVIYIDEGAVLGLSTDERQTICSSVAKIAAKYEFPTYVVALDKSLEDASTIGGSLRVLEPNTSIDFGEEDDAKLRGVVDSTSSATSREDLVRVLRNNLLLAAARHLACTKIFVADVENDLAVALLSNISLGRGAQLPHDVGFCDSRDPDVKVLRPMRDFMRREVTYYTAFLQLESVGVPSPGGADSVQSLTERFVAGLQEDFPGTISTVFRTGEKLSAAGVEDRAEEACALCRATLDAKSSAGDATDFSRLVSALGPAGFDDTTVGKTPEDTAPQPQKEVRQCSVPSSGGCGCRASSGCSEGGVTWAQAEEFLCYGCRLIARELDQRSCHVPSAVLQRINEQSNYKHMRKEIQDFLL